MDLDTEPWATLPEELRERVFAWLPPESFCRFRCVHRGWEELLLSQNFRETYSRAWEAAEPWVMLGLYRPSDNPQPECWMYNPKREAWHRQDFSFLPTLGAEVLASDGGLVCCQTESNLYVCNPLISCWTQIVPANAFNLYSDSVALTVNPKTKAYKVVIIGLQPEIDTYEVHVFDSTTGDWERGARAPCGFKVTDPVITNGHLFCVTINWDIVAYNLDRKEWSRIEVPDDMRPSLMAHNDRLLMGNVFISDDGLFSHVMVFDVELPTRQVRQVGEMPEDLLQELNDREGHDSFGVEFLEGNTISIRLDTNKQRLLMYHAPRGTWRWLPECPAEGSSDMIEPCYFYKPTLDCTL